MHFSFFHRAKAAVPAVAGAGITPAPVVVPALSNPKTASEKKIEKKKEPKESSLQNMLKSLGNFGMGKERLRFIENLGILLNAGLTIIDALKTIQMETRSKPMKKVIAAIIADVEKGSALWRAMEAQRFFTPYALALIRIGEEAGSLSKNMEYLAEQQEKDRALRQKVKMAMLYPSIVLTLTIIITLGLAWFVLPKLVGVLLSLNVELPLITRIIIAIADFFQKHGKVAVPLFGLACFFVVLLCKYTRLKGPTQQFIFKIPGIGTLALTATIARFGVILGSLLRAGVPLVDALHSMADVTDTVAYRKFYYKLAAKIEVGDSFAKAFAEIKDTNKILPLSVQQLVVTGEKSGSLSDMLLKIASIYEKKAEETAHKLPIILEPILLFFIGGVVATVAFAIIVPIYSIVGSIGR